MQLDEQELVKRARGGDVAAFEELIVDQQDRIYNLAYRMVGDPELAMDLAQEVFLKAFRSIKGFRSQARFSTWLYSIGTNVCLDEIRKMKRRPLQQSLDKPIETGDGQVERELASSRPGPVEEAERRETQRAVQEALLRIPPDQRLLIVLRDMEDLPYQEIADRMGWPLGTVKSSLYRARQALKEQLLESELLSLDDVQRGRRDAP